MNFDSPTLRGWQGFTKFPNTSPSGKRVDSDDPFPRKPLNLGKKCHPQSVGVDTRPPEPHNGRIEVVSWNYAHPLPHPYI
jgi:hypothetical protein